jgi:hypothetical protein
MHVNDLGAMEFAGGYPGNLHEEINNYSIIAGVVARTLDYDIIHAHDWLTYPAGIHAKQVSGKPLCIHVHATDFDRSRGKVNPTVYSIEKNGMDNADCIMCVSELTRQTVINQYHQDPRKCFTVHNAVYPLPEEYRENFRREWTEIQNHLDKFQCIVVWVPFNEAWGQFETPAIVDLTRKNDASRLINMASGGNWISGGVGDILDSHYYPHPQMRIWDDALVNVLGEYGGIGLPVKDHMWIQDNNWGYVEFATSDEATAKYEEFSAMMPELVKQGCSAAIYTQTTDVERELNGFMTYDRAVDKLDPARVSAANRRIIELLDQ